MKINTCSEEAVAILKSMTNEESEHVLESHESERFDCTAYLLRHKVDTSPTDNAAFSTSTLNSFADNKGSRYDRISATTNIT